MDDCGAFSDLFLLNGRLVENAGAALNDVQEVVKVMSDSSSRWIKPQVLHAITVSMLDYPKMSRAQTDSFASLHLDRKKSKSQRRRLLPALESIDKVLCRQTTSDQSKLVALGVCRAFMTRLATAHHGFAVFLQAHPAATERASR